LFSCDILFYAAEEEHMSIPVWVSGVSAFLVAGGVAQADEAYPFIPELLPPHLSERAALQSGQLLLGNISDVDEYFISAIKVWDTSQPIRVCFFSGQTQLRSKIATIAMQWTQQGAYIPLDFGSLQSPRTCSSTEFTHIRIGFQYRGYWSTVGTDSVNLAAQSEQSMNFALFDVNPPSEPAFSRVVLHEFGHALGFQHEHQSSNSPCSSEFNWDAIYQYLQGPPNYWSVEQIDHNLRPRVEPGDVASPFDADSIMLYSFPASFYKSGTAAECYTAGNNVISIVDIEGVKRFYPSDVALKSERTRQALSLFNATVDALTNVSDDAKSAAKLTASSLSRTSESSPFFQDQSMRWQTNLPTTVFIGDRAAPLPDATLGLQNYLTPPGKL
jgi:hypothetical protein